MWPIWWGWLKNMPIVIDWHRLEKISPQTYHAIMMLHLFTPWSDAVKKSLPFDSDTSFNFKDFPQASQRHGGQFQRPERLDPSIF